MIKFGKLNMHLNKTNQFGSFFYLQKMVDNENMINSFSFHLNTEKKELV